MLSKTEVIDILKNQLALECSCNPEDFQRPATDNIITPPSCDARRRRYFDKPFFFKMVTMGTNSVITADECLHDWLTEFVKDKQGHRLFEHPSLREIDGVLSQYGKCLYTTHHMFLPIGTAKEMNCVVKLKWLEQADIMDYYTGEFSNALCDRFIPERPDMLAVAAVENDKIIGIAGCSADTPDMWQIGIDVNETCRGRGIGSYLVNELTKEIFRRDKLPFYGASLSNIHSWNIALNCGFLPSWVEVETRESTVC